MELFRDKCGVFTPNGRPWRKPCKLVEHISQIETNHNHVMMSYDHAHLNTIRPKLPGLGECMARRPPMSTDVLTTPTPCTYNITYTHDTPSGVLVYRNRYFNKSENPRLPTPCTYNPPSKTMGVRLQSMKSYPSYSIGKEKRPTSSRKDTHPGPGCYDIVNKSKPRVKTTRQRLFTLTTSRQNNMLSSVEYTHHFTVHGANIALSNKTFYCRIK